MFCRHCGTALLAGAGFCSGCGARIRTAAPGPAPRQPLKDKLMDGLMLPIAVILILLGITFMGLMFAGRTVTAQVTGYEQQYMISNDDSTRNPSRYKLAYQFAVNGERYTGSVTRIFEDGSHMRQAIPVRYLPFWPYVNAWDGGTAGLAGPVMAGVGVLLLLGRKKRKSRAGRRMSHRFSNRTEKICG